MRGSSLQSNLLCSSTESDAFSTRHRTILPKNLPQATFYFTHPFATSIQFRKYLLISLCCGTVFAFSLYLPLAAVDTQTPSVFDSLPLKKQVILKGECLVFGAGEGNRTPDLFITREMLYRLSYTSVIFFCKD